jgi:hypothetical protein
MKLATIKSARKDFKGLPPCISVLGQDPNDKVKICNSYKKITYVKMKNINKQVLLKSLHKHLFFEFNGRYMEENTLIVDNILT